MSYPTAISRQDDGGIRITWDDATETCWTPSQLRARCPCATCREQKRGTSQGTQGAEGKSGAAPLVLPVISAAEARPLQVQSMRPVGNYAYSITFSDGHSSGIFPFVLLKDQNGADS